MACLPYVFLFFNLGSFLFVGLAAECTDFIAEKRQREGSYAKRTPIGIDGCVELCEQSDICFAVNYFRLNATCQFLNLTMPESKLVKAARCFYKSVRGPTKESIDNDPCYQKLCPWDQICMRNSTTNLAECFPCITDKTYTTICIERDKGFGLDEILETEFTQVCKPLPVKLWTINESIEADVGQNYTYRCQDGLTLKSGQNPTVTCLRDGSWTSERVTCVCKNPPTKSWTTNETAEVEVGQNYTYKCQDGLYGKSGMNPAVKCLQDGSWSSTNFTCVCKTPPAKPWTISETAEMEIGQNYTYRCQDKTFNKGGSKPTVTCQHDGNWTTSDLVCVKQNWTQDTIYPNNIHNSEVISYETGIDLLVCMQQCDDKANCLSFFYDNHTGHCVLSSSFRRGIPEGFKFSNGLVYYTAPSATCDMGYLNVTLDRSYFCVKYHSVTATFNDAMKICESERAKLLVITTQTQLVDAQKLIKNDFTYIGLWDASSEGHWVNWKGEELRPFWCPGQPSGGTNENCLVIWPGCFTGDFHCTYSGPFLCHKSNV